MSKNITQNDELNDWVDALENLILFNGKENASNLLEEFFKHVKNKGLIEQTNFALPFQNSISQYEEIDYPV